MILGDLLKKLIPAVFSIFLILIFNSCSVFEKSTKNEESTVIADSAAFDPSMLINELMEEARLKYIDALASQEIGFTEGAIKAYEDAGYPCAEYLELADNGSAAYMDTWPLLGHMVELYRDTQGIHDLYRAVLDLC